MFDMKDNDIISRISHELRTPLTSIMGLNQIIGEKPADEETVKDCSKKIATASEFLLALVNNIMTLEELENGKAVLESKQFVLGLSSVHIIVDGNIADIIIGENHFDQFTRFQVVTSEP